MKEGGNEETKGGRRVKKAYYLHHCHQPYGETSPRHHFPLLRMIRHHPLLLIIRGRFHHLLHPHRQPRFSSSSLRSPEKGEGQK